MNAMLSNSGSNASTSGDDLAVPEPICLAFVVLADDAREVKQFMYQEGILHLFHCEPAPFAETNS